ncbi:MAG: hypothetical protein M1457_06525 [bacterium]|nr:hypothetical protein [bacterium]
MATRKRFLARKPAGWIWWVLLAVPVALQGVFASRFAWITDQAFIVFRYAGHLLEGRGLVWNVGERPPVEGFTSLLYVLMMALGHGAGLSYVGWSILFNLLCSWATIILSAIVLRRILGKPTWLSLVPPALLAVNMPFNYWVAGGVSAHLFGALYLAIAALAIGWHGALTARRLGILSGLFGLLSLAHPSGMPIFAICAAMLAWRIVHGRSHGPDHGVGSLYAEVLHKNHDAAGGRERRPPNQAAAHPFHPAARGGRAMGAAIRLASLVGPFLAVAGLHVGWRLVYYGHPLPNPFYAMGLGVGWPLAGWDDLLDYVLKYEGVQFWLLILLSLPFWPRLGWQAAEYVMPPLLVVLIFGGGELREFPFMAGILPLMYICFGIALSVYLEAVHFARERWRIYGHLAVLALVAGFGLHLWMMDAYRGDWSRIRRLPERIAAGEWPPMDGRDDDPARPGALYLKGALPPGSLVAADIPGRLGFYSGLPVLDMRGFVDGHIAHAASVRPAGGEAETERGVFIPKFDNAYVLERRPAAILFGYAFVRPDRLDFGDPKDIINAWGPLGISYGDYEMYAHIDFWEFYRPEIVALADGEYLHMFRRTAPPTP